MRFPSLSPSVVSKNFASTPRTKPSSTTSLVLCFELRMKEPSTAPPTSPTVVSDRTSSSRAKKTSTEALLRRGLPVQLTITPPTSDNNQTQLTTPSSTSSLAVERILDHRLENGEDQVLIEWNKSPSVKSQLGTSGEHQLPQQALRVPDLTTSNLSLSSFWQPFVPSCASSSHLVSTNTSLTFSTSTSISSRSHTRCVSIPWDLVTTSTSHHLHDIW